LADFLELQKTKADSENSWSVDVFSIDKDTFDLSVKNPNKGEEEALRDPKEILEEMKRLDKGSEAIIDSIFRIINED
jgi:type I restriction enzyme M protein